MFFPSLLFSLLYHPSFQSNFLVHFLALYCHLLLGFVSCLSFLVDYPLVSGNPCLIFLFGRQFFSIFLRQRLLSAPQESQQNHRIHPHQLIGQAPVRDFRQKRLIMPALNYLSAVEEVAALQDRRLLSKIGELVLFFLPFSQSGHHLLLPASYLFQFPYNYNLWILALL